MTVTNKPSIPIKSQRETIKVHLQLGGSLSTLYARKHYGIMHVAARVMELRNMGYNIATHRRYETDVTGTVHRVAYYVLHRGEVNGAKK